MTLTFVYRPSFGRARFYAEGAEAYAVQTVARRKCLDLDDLAALYVAGFEVRVLDHATRVETAFVNVQTLIRNIKGA